MDCCRRLLYNILRNLNLYLVLFLSFSVSLYQIWSVDNEKITKKILVSLWYLCPFILNILILLGCEIGDIFCKRKIIKQLQLLSIMKGIEEILKDAIENKNEQNMKFLEELKTLFGKIENQINSIKSNAIVGPNKIVKVKNNSNSPNNNQNNKDSNDNKSNKSDKNN